MGQIDWGYWVGALLIFVVVGPFPLWAVWHDARQSEKMRGKDMWFVTVEDAKGRSISVPWLRKMRMKLDGWYAR